MLTLALALGLASLLIGVSSLVEPRSRATVLFAWTKFVSNAWAPYLALAGGLGVAFGVIAASPAAVAIGLAGAAVSAVYVWRVTRPGDGFARAFGPAWHSRIPVETERRMLRRRWSWHVPAAPEARVRRDVAFARVPGTPRMLLCDLWQPPTDTPTSGLAIVYLHGSAWTLIDKDTGTRPFFGHLAAQGHIVMDVAYRLCPEADIVGMVADAKRAVAWMKDHAAELGARADGVVLMGASAGAHVALLAAYTPGVRSLTPDDVGIADTSVRAVVSYYGIPDMHDYDASARRFLPPGPERPWHRSPPGSLARWLNRRLFGRDLKPENLPPPPPHHELMRELLGGLPADVPEMAGLASPITHVTSTSPPTLLLQGQHDQIAPLASARRLARALERDGVPVVLLEYPWTGHAFDLLVPPLLGPAGQAALHDVERFLACLEDRAGVAARIAAPITSSVAAAATSRGTPRT